MKTLFIQVSSNLLGDRYQNTQAYRYYNSIYNKPGYWRSEHFWEIPLWIAEASYFLPGIKDILIITDSAQKVEGDYDLILCSVMDANRDIISQVLSHYEGPAQVIAGSYTNFSLPGVRVLDNMQALADAVGVVYKKGLDYSLFEGERTIPRLTLSTGCKNNCRFCATSKTLELESPKNIIEQAKSFEPLQFRYVYIADSTFGQADNYRLLASVYDIITDYNPEFEGFIIQSTAAQLNKPGFIPELPDLGVKIVEIGMESYNDHILKTFNKPANERLIKNAVDSLNHHGLKIILNIIIGLQGETRESYQQTLDFITDNPVFGYNIYNLAIYKGSALDQEIKANNQEDRSEHELNKSYLTKEEIDINTWFYNKLFSIVI